VLAPLCGCVVTFDIVNVDAETIHEG